MAKKQKNKSGQSRSTKPGAEPRASPFGFNVLGIAEAARQSPDTPVVALDVFQLSSQKAHLIYPISLEHYRWVFIVHMSIALSENPIPLKIELFKPDGTLQSWASVQVASVVHGNSPFRQTGSNQNQHDGQVIAIREQKLMSDTWLFGSAECKGLITEPGTYPIKLSVGNEQKYAGSIDFIYTPVPPFTQEKINAIKSDAYATKTVRIAIGCKKFKDYIRIYAGLDRDMELEKSGLLWQHGVNIEQFKCKCGNVVQNLKYVKENLHSIIGKNAELDRVDIARRYGHRAIIDIVENYNRLLNDVKTEHEIQKFIEQNQVLLSMFHAKNLFGKTNIIGKFETDFVVHDVRGQLLFIEIENPNIPLFNKRNSHMTAKLSHAYYQVQDWLHEYDKHRNAILEQLNIEKKDVTRIKGVVIAGRTANTNQEYLQKHLASSAYANIDFYTYDDLARELMQISKGLA